MDSTTLAINTAKSFIADCNSQLDLQIDKAYLFGSYAKGNAHQWSDIDVLIFGKKFSTNSIQNLKLFSKINFKYPSIEVHSYPSESKINTTPFLQNVLKDAVEIF